MVFLTRRATFSASHYYWIDAWPAEKNQEVFGRCANRNGHGHNYTLEVTVAGNPDSVTGFVVDLKWLKDVIERANKVPTTENIAIAIWQRLQPAVSSAGGAKLDRIRVYETPEIFAEFRGGA
jgi:6-pyruvoyltetrahydropterin/6-carboxytetrahydropterin synthase